MPILYQPDDTPTLSRTFFYSLQFLAFNLINIAIVPLVVGSAFHLPQTAIADLAQRTLFFISLASILQALFGHRLPLLEGPAGTWWGIFIILANMAPGIGKSLPVLLTDLELGLMITGLFLVLFGLSGIMGRIIHLFTPAVTGSVLVLLTTQLAGTFVRGMLGISDTHLMIDPKAVLVSAMVLLVVVWVNLKGQGFVRSIAVLIGTLVGWLCAAGLGIAALPHEPKTPLIKLPALFAWGTPTYDPGIVLVTVISGILILASLVAALLAMDRVLGTQQSPKIYNRSIIFTGIGDILTGIGATIGVVPFTASAGLISITGVAARAPFILAALMLMGMGLLPSFSLFLSTIPAPVAYTVMLVTFAQLIGFGFKDYARLPLSSRELFVIGIPVIFGTGIMMLPTSVFSSLPVILKYTIGNGFIVGMILCLLLEHLILPAKYFETENE